MSTASISCQTKKAKDCFIFHRVLLVIILLLTITIIWYHYGKQKCINILTMQKWRIMKFEKFELNIVHAIILIRWLN